MGLFGPAHGWGRGKRPPKICHTYPTMMKLGTVILYLKKFKKYMNYMTHPLSSASISIFSLEIANCAISRNTDIDCILMHNF